VRPALLTVGDALRAVRTIGPLAARDPYRGPWADADSELADLEDVLSALPQGWRSAANAVTLPAPGALEVFFWNRMASRLLASRVPPRHGSCRWNAVLCRAWGGALAGIQFVSLTYLCAGRLACRCGPILKSGCSIVGTLWTLWPPWMYWVTPKLWPFVISRLFQCSASFGSCGGIITSRRFFGGWLSMGWQQLSACICSITVVCVALWSVVNLADATTSGIARLPKLCGPDATTAHRLVSWYPSASACLVRVVSGGRSPRCTPAA
jgi:hypothetical protein